MQISWNGLGSFVIQGKPIQGEVALVTDPFENSVGIRFPRTLTAAVVLQSHNAPESNNVKAVGGEKKKKPFIIKHAGEYEVSGIFVTGISASKKDETPHTIYRIRMKDIAIGFLGAIDRKLKDEEIEALGDIDILIVPVGGGNVLEKGKAAEVVAQVQPRMIIPSHFGVKGLKKKLDNVEGFCKEVACPYEEINKLKVSKNDLPDEDVVVRILSRG